MLGIPLITTDKKIIDWNRSQACLQILSLSKDSRLSALAIACELAQLKAFNGAAPVNESLNGRNYFCKRHTSM